MNEFVCQGCGTHSFSAASLENLRIKTCEKCGAPVAQLGPEPPRKPKIIAVDFDGCLVTNRFPDIGEPVPETITALKREQENGAKVILWTCRRDDQVKAAAEWCAQQGIHLDAVNRNLPEIVEAFGGDTVKVFANEYWDDRAVKMPPTKCADAHKNHDGTCAGYQRSENDDEPCDRCKTCPQNEFYEEE